MPHFIVSVALPIHLRKLFDYIPAPGQADQSLYKPGIRCIVPFGSRRLPGIIITTKKSSSVAKDSLKAILELLDTEPFIKESTLAIYQWISQYYHAPLGEVIFSALPPLLRKPLKQRELYQKVSSPCWKLTVDNPEAASKQLRGARQKSLLDLLGKYPEGLLQKDIKTMGFQLSQLKSLQDKQLVSCYEHAVSQTASWQTRPLPELNDEQQTAFNTLCTNPDNFLPVVLDGVTGSGKTEVYIRWLHFLIESDLIKSERSNQGNGQALILVPEIALTPQTIRRFKKYFGNQVTCYHSAMPAKERLRSWMLTQQNKATIVIGTRSALLLPFNRLLTIIVDEEHDSSFKQQDGARYHARDVAILMARLNNCPIIMGSATPSFESLYNASGSRFIKLNLSKRHANQPLPEFTIIDVKSRPMEGGISPPAMQTISKRLEDGWQIMVFINRRGYAPVLMCTDCGWSAECSCCDVRLTYHLRSNSLRCHHCDRSYSPPRQCPKCKAENIRAIGAGTERTEEVLKQHFPDTPIIRIDRDNTQSVDSFNRSLTKINSGEPCLVVGTQMLAKGHDFPKLNTVLIVNADGGLFSSDFRAVEKTAQLMIQVSGRAGRHSRTGEVLLQTQFPNHPLIQAITKHDYHAIYEAEIKLRRQAKLPPVFQLCIIRADAVDTSLSSLTLQKFKTELAALATPDIRILGPVPSVLHRKKNRYRSLLWVLAEEKSDLRKLLYSWLQWRAGQNLTTSSKVRWHVDVDPADTL